MLWILPRFSRRMVSCHYTVGALLLGIAFLMGRPLQAEPLVWKGQGMTPRPEQVEVFEDPSALMDSASVRGREFRPATDLNFKETRSAIWLRFRLEPETSGLLYLVIQHPLLDEVDVYVTSTTGERHMQSGRSLPSSRWTILDRNFLFPIEATAGEPLDVIIRVRSGNSVAAPISLLPVTDLVSMNGRGMIAYALILGGILFIMVNNIILFASLRDLPHLLFAFYMLSVFLFLCALTGFGSVLLWGEMPYINQRMISWTIASSVANLLLFQAHYLKLRVTRPMVFRLFQGLSVVFGIQFLMAFAPDYHYSALLGIRGSLVASILLIGVSAMEARRSREGRLLFVTWIIVLLTAFFFVLKVLGVIPDLPVIHLLMPVGFLGQMLFINFSLSQRVRELNDGLSLEKAGLQYERHRLESVLVESRNISVSLRGLSGSEKDMARKLSNVSQEEASMTEELASAMEEIFSRTESVLEGMKRQNQKASVIDDSLRELQSTRETVRATMDRTMAFFQQMETGFQSFRGNLEELLGRLQVIRDAGQVIQDVIRMIREVTEKINMLSLNASIEAARAGEYGRGFSVVADEVGKLAEATGSNSKKIQGQVSLMDAEMSGGVEATRRAGESIEQLSRALMVTKEQLAGVNESMAVLEGAVGQIEAQFRDNRSLSDEVFSASTEQLAALQESLGTVARLSQMATRLAKSSDEILELSDAVDSEAVRLGAVMEASQDGKDVAS